MPSTSPCGLAAGSSKLEDAHAARLQLTDAGRYLVSVTPPLLLRTSQAGTAEPGRVAGGGRGAAAALQDLVPVPAVAALAQRLQDRRR